VTAATMTPTSRFVAPRCAARRLKRTPPDTWDAAARFLPRDSGGLPNGAPGRGRRPCRVELDPCGVMDKRLTVTMMRLAAQGQRKDRTPIHHGDIPPGRIGGQRPENRQASAQPSRFAQEPPEKCPKTVTTRLYATRATNIVRGKTRAFCDRVCTKKINPAKGQRRGRTSTHTPGIKEEMEGAQGQIASPRLH